MHNVPLLRASPPRPGWRGLACPLRTLTNGLGEGDQLLHGGKGLIDGCLQSGIRNSIPNPIEVPFP